jgi:gentisate 1,2-dioxygenase
MGRGPRRREPEPTARPQRWDWQQTAPLLLESGNLVTAAEAERRFLALANPAYPDTPKATATLFAALQMILPGETAPAHRHRAGALHFVLQSDGGFVAVEGQRAPMRAGDLIVTPPWSSHGHGNDGNRPAIWLDVLDAPMTAFFETDFFEPSPLPPGARLQPLRQGPARLGAGLGATEGATEGGEAAPRYHYGFAQMRAALIARAGAPGLDAHWGASLRYADAAGGTALPTIAAWMMHLPAGFATAPLRSTDGMIVAVVEGSGCAQLGGERLSFAPGDVFIAPNWTARRFEASAHADCFLFCCSDRAAQQKLGLWRQEPVPVAAFGP